MAKVLVIEDEQPVAELIRELFEGHEVHLAHDGEDGLAQARTLRPDLIILDVGLPKLSGFDVCRALKRDPEHRKIKILMLTGKGTMSDVEQGFEERADDYIVKPFQNKVLVARAGVLLAKKS